MSDNPPSIGSYVKFDHANGYVVRGVVTEINHETGLYLIHSVWNNNTTYWMQPCVLKRDKRPTPDGFEGCDPDHEFSIGDRVDVLDEYEGTVRYNLRIDNVDVNDGFKLIPEKGMPIFVGSNERHRLRIIRPSKRLKPEAIKSTKCPILDLVLGYMNGTWVEQHTACRWYMICSGEPTLHYTKENDESLITLIRSYFKDTLGFGDNFWKWMDENPSVFTGSAMLALAHGGAEGIRNWKCGDYDVFMRRPKLTPGENPRIIPTLFRCIFGNYTIEGIPNSATDVFVSKTGIRSTDNSYRKFIEGELASFKFTKFNGGKSHTVNMIVLKDDATAIPESRVSKQITKHKDGTDYTYEEVLYENETLHEYILRVFDLRLLAMSYDGKTLSIGRTGSVEERDRVAMLLSEYRVNLITQEPQRSLERISKYRKRGVTITNDKEVYYELGKSLTLRDGGSEEQLSMNDDD